VPLQLKLFERRPHWEDDPESPEYLFASTYLLTRFTVGLVAFALPWGLVTTDRVFRGFETEIRGSMSAYFHSGAREVFVGALFVVGAFMLTYMAARPRTWDHVLSSVGGLAAIGVAVFPTAREGVYVSDASCESEPLPQCAAVQERLGEATTQLVHGFMAGVLVLVLAALCVVFALRELGYGPAARDLLGDDRDVRRVLASFDGPGLLVMHLLVGRLRGDGTGRHPHARGLLWNLLFAAVILLGGAYAVLVDTYWGEVIAFTGFGVAWLYAGRELRVVRRFVRRVNPRGEAASGR
jgi:hypothetical protein